MMRRYRLLALLLLAVVATPGETAARPCRRGRFLLPRTALVEGGTAGLEMLSLAPSRIALSLGCRGVRPVLSFGPRGTRVRAAWSRCSGLLDESGRPARVKLKGYIAAPACDTLSGALVVQRAEPKRRDFTGILSRCGDGYLDTGNGEQCGDGGASCPARTACTDRCTCTASFTTTTVSSSTSTTTFPGQFGCTEILGFSQTLQWMDTPEFEQHIDDARWQARLRAGGDVDVWADPNADVWSAPENATCHATDIGQVAFCSPCARGSDAPDRILFTITLQAYESSVDVWAQKIRAAIATIRAKHPQAHQIVLQPVVGGPLNSVCPVASEPLGVRASYNHPFIDQAIAQVIHDAPDLAAGLSPEVHSCADYMDDVGHLLPVARGPIGMDIGQYYGP